MLIDVVIVAVVAVALIGALLMRYRSHNDELSVQGYHRQIHTLEEINEHTSHLDGAAVSPVSAKHAYPESAVRLSGSSTVRVTDAPAPPAPPAEPPLDDPASAGPPTAPPAEAPVDPSPDASPPDAAETALPRVPMTDVAAVPPPLEAGPDEIVKFDDVRPHDAPNVPGLEGTLERAIAAMNRRPRRLLAPALAVLAVGVLVVVLIVTGSHTVAPPKHHAAAASPPARTHSHTTVKHAATPTSTTAAPQIVSAPQGGNANGATYDVAAGTFTVGLSATSGACWVDATNSTTGASLFTGVLPAGQSQSVAATGPVTVDVGAPSDFAATVNGTAIALPAGLQTPFTIKFVPSVAGVG
jgi:hypothetical protein